MANSATRTSLITRVRQASDTENSQHVTDTEIGGWLNVGLSELYDLLVTHFEDMFETILAIPTIVGTADYALPADFYKLLALDLTEGNTKYTLGRFMNRERNRYQNNMQGSSYAGLLQYRVIGLNLRLVPTPTAVRTLTLSYIPTFVELTGSGAVNPAIPQGWEEYAVLDAASKVAIKEESFEQAAALLQLKAAMQARIERAADDRDANEPVRVVDVGRRFDDFWYNSEEF